MTDLLLGDVTLRIKAEELAEKRLLEIQRLSAVVTAQERELAELRPKSQPEKVRDYRDNAERTTKRMAFFRRYL